VAAGETQVSDMAMAQQRERAAAANAPLKSGWLVKQGHVFKNWKRRYFVLMRRPGTTGRSLLLVYYDTEYTATHAPEKCKGAIPLEQGYFDVMNEQVSTARVLPLPPPSAAALP
jgi:hypothetical protein